MGNGSGRAGNGGECGIEIWNRWEKMPHIIRRTMGQEGGFSGGESSTGFVCGEIK